MSIAAFVVIATLVLLASYGVVMAASTQRQLTALAVCSALVAALALFDGSVRLALVITLVTLAISVLVWRSDRQSWKFVEWDLLALQRTQFVPLVVVGALTLLLVWSLFAPSAFFTHPIAHQPSQTGFLHQGFLLWVALLVLLSAVSGLAIYKLAAVDQAEQVHAKATEVRRRHREQMLKRRQARLANRGDVTEPGAQA